MTSIMIFMINYKQLRLENRQLIIKGFRENNYVNKRISFVHEGDMKLQKAFSFIIEIDGVEKAVE